MTYLADYEIIKPRIIGYRQIPKLRKYYRSDNSYDLFYTEPVPLLLRQLTAGGYAGIAINRANGWCTWGNYIFGNINASTGNDFDYLWKSVFQGGKGWTRASFLLKADNPYGYVVRDHGITAGGKGSGLHQQINVVYNGSTVSVGTQYSTVSVTPHLPLDYKTGDYLHSLAQFYDNDSSGSWSQSAMHLHLMKRISIKNPLYTYFR